MIRKNRTRSPRLRNDDAGFSLAELVVSMALMGLLGAIGIGAYIAINGTTVGQVDRVKVWSGMQDANGQLMRDIADATSMPVAAAQTIAVNVVRDGKCQTRTYAISAPDFLVTTKFFELASCSGASEDRVATMPGDFVSTASFTYYGETDKLIPPPVKDARTVRRVQWKLEADLGPKTTNNLVMESGAAFSGRGDTAGTGDPLVQAQSPLLTVVTGTTGKEGVDAPVLAWADPTATLTTGWTVYRTANPAGLAHTDPAYTGSQQLWSTPTAATTTWTDASLPAGYVASYYVRAWIPNAGSGMGPESNKVVTGLRPSQVKALTATGKPTSIDLAWTAAVGATSYDVYRTDLATGTVGAYLTNVTVAKSGTARTWTDDFLGVYGNSHRYTIIGVNQWETLSKASGAVRIQSATAGAFTAPANPDPKVVPTNSWSNVVTPALAGWVGTGPTGARDRGWEVQSHLNAGAFTNLWTGAGEVPGATLSKTDGSRVPGTFTYYQVRTCNPVGCSPWANEVRSLQRPATPTCTPSGETTRSMVVTVNPQPMPETAYTSYEVTGGTGTPTGTGQQGTTVFSIDQLTHGTTQAWAARTANATGWSDAAGCGATTVTLATPAITVTAITTRGANAAATCTNGSSCTVSIDGGAASRNDLKDGTDYPVHASNTDGWQTVGADSSFKTLVLSTPSAPVCVATITDGTAPGAITISGGDRVKLSSGGTTYASPRGYGGLGDGTYNAYAQSTNSDGLNFAASAWDACPSRTINAAPPAAVTGLSLTCSGGSSASGSWIAVPGATSYTVETQWRDAGIWYAGTGSTTSGTTTTVSSSTGSCMNGVKFRVTATSASGTSVWSAYKQVP